MFGKLPKLTKLLSDTPRMKWVRWTFGGVGFGAVVGLCIGGMGLVLLASVTTARAAELRLGWTTPAERAVLLYTSTAFVADGNKCPTMASNDLLMMRTIEGMGYSVDDITTENEPSIKLWLSRLIRGGTESCTNLYAAFGPSGTLMRGIIIDKK